MSNTYPCLSSNHGFDPHHPLRFPTNVTKTLLTNQGRMQQPCVSQLCGIPNEPVYQYTMPLCSFTGSMANIPGNVSAQTHFNDQRTLEIMNHSKDMSIKQKDDIIEKQDQYIRELVRQLQEGHNDSSNGHLLRKLKKKEGDVEHLRMRLETETAPKYEAERLRKKLGETEYELEKTEKVLEEIINEKKTEQQKYSEQVDLTSKKLEDSKKDVITLKEENLSLKTRIDALDKYVSDIPTAEDHKRLRRELKYWKKTCSKLHNQMSEQEEKFNSGRKDLEEKAMNADRFEKENTDLQQMVKSLQDMMKKDEIHSKTMELEHVKFENERLQADLENMEKLLKEQQKKTKAFYLRNKESQKLLVERLSQEEDTVGALREEIATKEITISELKSSMKQLSAQLSDLMEEKMDLSDRVKQLQLINSKEVLDTNRKIYKQLRQCVTKLKDMMTMYSQRKEGKDVDLSLLLGTGGSLDQSRVQFSVTEGSLSDQVTELAENIEELRAFFADQYAEELASNLDVNCTTQ